MKVISLELCAATNHSNFLKKVGLKKCAFSLSKCNSYINTPTSKCRYSKYELKNNDIFSDDVLIQQSQNYLDYE